MISSWEARPYLVHLSFPLVDITCYHIILRLDHFSFRGVLMLDSVLWNYIVADLNFISGFSHFTVIRPRFFGMNG